jgi:hypothetical protein
MNETLHIDNETLVAYLYDEVDAPDKARVERHLQRCGTCGGEFAALSSVRTVLRAWAPPDADLGFTVVQKSARPEPAHVLRPAPWWNTVPVWAQAAAAILVLAVSAGVANIQVRSGADGFVVTTGWMSQVRPAADAPPVMAADVAGGENWNAALVALEQQLRSEIRASRSTGAETAVRASSRSGADETTIRRVQELLAASEARQERELALRLTQFNLDTNIQRQADLVRIQKLFGQSGDEIARQGQVLNYMIRASGRPQQ